MRRVPDFGVGPIPGGCAAHRIAAGGEDRERTLELEIPGAVREAEHDLVRRPASLFIAPAGFGVRRRDQIDQARQSQRAEIPVGAGHRRDRHLRQREDISFSGAGTLDSQPKPSLVRRERADGIRRPIVYLRPGARGKRVDVAFPDPAPGPRVQVAVCGEQSRKRLFRGFEFRSPAGRGRIGEQHRVISPSSRREQIRVDHRQRVDALQPEIDRRPARPGENEDVAVGQPRVEPPVECRERFDRRGRSVVAKRPVLPVEDINVPASRPSAGCRVQRPVVDGQARHARVRRRVAQRPLPVATDPVGDKRVRIADIDLPVSRQRTADTGVELPLILSESEHLLIDREVERERPAAAGVDEDVPVAGARALAHVKGVAVRVQSKGPFLRTGET